MMNPVSSSTTQQTASSYVEPFLLEVADVVNTTLDLETTLRRVAELVRKVIDYEIFAILLLNEQKQSAPICLAVSGAAAPETRYSARARAGGIRGAK